MSTAQAQRKVPTGPELLPPSTQILSSIDRDTLPSPPPISTHREAADKSFRILPLSHPSSVSGPEVPSCPSNHRKATQTRFSIVPIQPADDTDFGNQRAFGEWLDKETEMDEEHDSTMDDDIFLLSPAAPDQYSADEQLPVSTTTSPRKARNTNFRISPCGRSEWVPEIHNASLTISRFCQYSC